MRHKNQQKYIKSIFCENILTKMGFSIIILLFAGVAQSVVQLIRNQQVVCSSHITSSIKAEDGIVLGFYFFCALYCAGEPPSSPRNARWQEDVSANPHSDAISDIDKRSAESKILA